MNEINPILQFITDHPYTKVDLKFSNGLNRIRIGLSNEDVSIAYMVDANLIFDNAEFLETILNDLNDRLDPLKCF